VAGQVLQAGDYYWVAADSVHEVAYSEGGCLFLLLVLRAAKARTRDGLATAIRAARETVPARDASNGFRHDGYASSCCENRSSVASPSSPYRYKRAIISAASQISDNPLK
jgi:hypothetical protein